MRNTLIFVLISLCAVACAKDDAQPCKSCAMLISNAEPYSYKVSFYNWPGAPAPFTVKPGESKSISIPAQYAVTVIGDFQSPYAHNDFKSTYYCPGDCGLVSVLLKQ